MEDLLAATAGLDEITLSPGQVLLRDGEAAEHLYVLVEGRLMVRRHDEDFVTIDAPGACVGEMAVLLDRPHGATVVAVTASRLRVVEDARATLRDRPDVLAAVATVLAGRLDLVNQYLQDVQDQYRHLDGGLGLVGDVLKSLTTHAGPSAEPGSDREPDPLY
jgi:CRP/FNR family transcriptional regulator, cyclic AMP receptor protein